MQPYAIMDLVSVVEAYIRTHELLEPGAKVVVGVSGGPDSTVLLDILRRLAPSLQITLHVAHLHHEIRGVEADQDMAWVADLAEAWTLPFSSKRIDVPALAEEERLSEEEAARQARYGFLGRVAERVDASHIAVAHNADDQAETVLMHFLRGAGLAGLRGILPKTPLQGLHVIENDCAITSDITLIRPLLGVRRSDIEAHCKTQGLQPRLDRTNKDTTYFRNKLRHEVLPYLSKLNPNMTERLCNLAEVVRADYELLQEFVSVARDTLCVDSHKDARIFDLHQWRNQPLAIQRAIIRETAHELRPDLRDVGFLPIEQAVNVAQHGQTGARATLPQRLNLIVGYDTLTIARPGARHLPEDRPWLTHGTAVPIEIPGVTHLPGRWELYTQNVNHWNIEVIANNPNPWVAWIDADALGDHPKLRTRKSGDRFRPHGMDGSTMHLSDFLINIKVRRPWRDHLPLLVDDHDRILWVVGHRLGHEALVSLETERVVYLRFRGSKETSESRPPENL
jgi:tRNA(Ile)-lysidine synthase